MKIKNNNKYNSSFSMSSMTDIVFLLLIFFMLTSTLVSTSALEINLPKSESKDVKTKKLSISIDSSYNYYIENQIIEFTDWFSIFVLTSYTVCVTVSHNRRFRRGLARCRRSQCQAAVVRACSGSSGNK